MGDNGTLVSLNSSNTSSCRLPGKFKRIPHEVALKYVQSVWGGGTKSAHPRIKNIIEPSGALLGKVKKDCPRRTLCWSAARPQDHATVQYVGCTTPQCQFFSPSFQSGQFDNSCSSNGEYRSFLYKFIFALFSNHFKPHDISYEISICKAGVSMRSKACDQCFDNESFTQ